MNTNTTKSKKHNLTFNIYWISSERLVSLSINCACSIFWFLNSSGSFGSGFTWGMVSVCWAFLLASSWMASWSNVVFREFSCCLLSSAAFGGVLLGTCRFLRCLSILFGDWLLLWVSENFLSSLPLWQATRNSRSDLYWEDLAWWDDSDDFSSSFSALIF